MKDNLKYFALLLILFLVVNCAGILLRKEFELIFSSGELFTLSLAIATISAVALVIFFRGRKREEKEQVMYSFVALSIKFLLELFLALAWFVIAKKTSITYVILFFVLYLTFSMVSIGIILKALKGKCL